MSRENNARLLECLETGCQTEHVDQREGRKKGKKVAEKEERKEARKERRKEGMNE